MGDFCAVPVRAKYQPNIAKRNVRAFERRMNEEAWPAELQSLGQDCLLALKMIPGQEHLLRLPAFAECVLTPIEKFHEAFKALGSEKTSQEASP